MKCAYFHRTHPKGSPYDHDTLTADYLHGTEFLLRS